MTLFVLGPHPMLYNKAAAFHAVCH